MFDVFWPWRYSMGMYDMSYKPSVSLSLESAIEAVEAAGGSLAGAAHALGLTQGAMHDWLRTRALQDRARFSAAQAQAKAMRVHRAEQTVDRCVRDADLDRALDAAKFTLKMLGASAGWVFAPSTVVDNRSVSINGDGASNPAHLAARAEAMRVYLSNRDKSGQSLTDISELGRALRQDNSAPIDVTPTVPTTSVPDWRA